MTAMFTFGVCRARSKAMAAASFLLLTILSASTTQFSSSSFDGMSGISGGRCIPAERNALLSFKAGITHDPHNRLVSWQQGAHNCCQWSGVTCNNQTGHVVKLDLHRYDYPFPVADPFLGPGDIGIHSLHGQVSSSLLALRRLEYLDLSFNTLLGDAKAMPGFLGSLQSLTYLDLSNMGFRGRVPPQLGNLSKLAHLDIHRALDYTPLYSKDISWLAHLRSLEYLNMGFIDLSGVVDWIHTVNTLPSLVVLILYNCSLTKSPSSLVHHNLTVLEELDLSYNSLNTLAAPNWFWDITSLRSLILAGCELSGTFPDELRNLTLLVTFDISENHIKGMIPRTMRNMCNLLYLDLSSNNIGRDITEVLDRIPSCSWNILQVLILKDANLTGMILQFVSNLSSLTTLSVRYNQLSGSVPVEIGELKSLTLLDLGYNNLSGVISEDHFAGLQDLKDIELSHNNLELIIDSDWVPPFKLEWAWFSSCHLGPQFPKWLRWQKDIGYLDISNTGLVGRIPDWFWTTFSEATSLDISSNLLSGELPLNLDFMSVITLSMHSNQLTGLIPKLPSRIRVLDMSKNSLNGFVPNFRAPLLQVAVLFSNSISGTIPKSICLLRKLQFLDLSHNLLTKELPNCGRKELKWQNPSNKKSSRVNSVGSFSLGITTLLLSNNSFSSGFPLFLRQCPSLIFLDLTQNKFTGELPGWISEAMPGLIILRLSSNNFSGHIPVEIMGFHDVRIMDLSNNNFSGAIPRYIKKLKAFTSTATASNVVFVNPFDEGYDDKIMSLHMGLSNDSFSVVIKGQVLEYRENTLYLMSIDLSCNGLTGEIPKELSSLVRLINLNLSSNLLSGNIPYKIGNLRSLESLDLSKNKLGGEIPQSLSDLTYLSYLNLSYNDLSGRIPSGHQLDILKTDDPASMYVGNPGLCGHPIPVQCPGPPRDPSTIEDSARWPDDDLSQLDFLLGLIIGFVAGSWMVFCGLLFMKRWRYAYFGLLDKLYDRLYVVSVVTWWKWFGNTNVN